jgi:phosphatidylserine/phosphatidylglycerophosphate/cardiolipin synthase-like enzyme
MATVLQTINDPLRNALGGLLRVQILAALDEVAANGGSIYAALYELNDPELIGRFKKLGSQVNLILANGAFKPPAQDETSNAKTRADFRKLKTVKIYDRLVSSGHFAHNKFVVFCDAQGSPVRVLTGSTNWTVTGLCTQANNALFIDDRKVAGAYRDEWDRLKAAANTFPPALVDANSKQKTFTVDDADVTVWFVPTGKQQDMIQARTLIENAKDGALFLFFNPGHFADAEDQQTLLQTVLDRGRAGPHYDASLYIRGVVNQKIAGLTDDTDPAATNAKSKSKKSLSTLPSADEHEASNDPQASHTPVLLYSDATQPPTRATKDVLVPAAIKAKFHDWVPELLSMGVMVHSKVVVLDPFGDHPVLMTGSHNLGTKASRANDDNLVIVEGPGARSLAIAYAVNIIAIFQEYRWRNYVALHASDPNAWHGLDDDDKWQTGHLAGGNVEELKFWVGGAKIASQLNQAKIAAAMAPPASVAARSTKKSTKKTPAKRATKSAVKKRGEAVANKSADPVAKKTAEKAASKR